jgi:hypothetical protein
VDIGTEDPGVVSTYPSSCSGVSLTPMLLLKGPDENTEI